MNSATRSPEDNKRRKARWRSYIIGGVIFQIFIILVFLYIILRVRSIKIRIHSVKVENLITSNKSSFSMLLHTQVTIKNSNFGHYKFENSTIVLAYRGARVGEVELGNGRVKARSVKKIDVVVPVSLKTWMSFGSGHDSLRKIILTVSARMTGKVHILKVIRRRKLAEMDCAMDVDTKTQSIEEIVTRNSISNNLEDRFTRSKDLMKAAKEKSKRLEYEKKVNKVKRHF
ncbi:hypothetical protein L2E82_31641 [Cichorium intybus]|uniref:Uncharacterized protein n=1 Tax=Cichorium intybus TaxID=13427 RepID=A0ACB9BEL2_CICIN|nr:hypothetical protein L2E82_31641 [Cichorium intybus]